MEAHGKQGASFSSLIYAQIVVGELAPIGGLEKFGFALAFISQ